METSKTIDVKTPLKPNKIDEFTAQVVAMKVFFMNKVFQLKNQIAWLKEASLNVGNSFSEKKKIKYKKFKVSNFSFTTGNTFIKTELNNKQHIIEKLLNINSNKSNVNDFNITDNAHINRNYSVFENSSKNKGRPSENVKHQNRSGKPKKFTKKESDSHW